MKKTILAVLTAVVAVLAISSVFAYQYGHRENAGIDRTAAENAVESGDYVAWKALHADRQGRMSSLITEENFSLLKEMHEAREAGDFANVQEIKAKLGFEAGRMHAGKGNAGNSRTCPYTS